LNQSGSTDCPVCTEQCPVPRLAPPANMPPSRKTQRVADIIHRTIRCAPNCPVSQSRPRQRLAAQSAGDAWTSPTVTRPHRTVMVHTQIGKANCFPFEEQTSRCSLGPIKGPPKRPSKSVEHSQVQQNFVDSLQIILLSLSCVFLSKLCRGTVISL
jgi:hypothetical protein